ncbi:MAG: hypothetical protein J6Y94_01745 [Bacteriovoracaceae bacterium]|nr:hypothetical protein [Bacteriovoracaceae bacterium]
MKTANLSGPIFSCDNIWSYLVRGGLILLLTLSGTSALAVAPSSPTNPPHETISIFGAKTNLKSATSPLALLEKDFKDQHLHAVQITDEEYVTYLHRVKAYLDQMGINSSLQQNPNSIKHIPLLDHYYLHISPQGSHPLNRLASEIAQQGYVIQYFTKAQLANGHKYFYQMLTDESLKRWYLSASALSDVDFFLDTYVVKNNKELVLKTNLPPLADLALNDCIFSYQDPYTLSSKVVDPNLLYSSIVLDEAAKIYVPFIHQSTTQINPYHKYRLINLYKALQKMAAKAEKIRDKIKRQEPLSDSQLGHLQKDYLEILNKFIWHIIDLNATYYLLAQHPSNVNFHRFQHLPDRLKIFAHPDPHQVPFAYVLNIPYQGSIKYLKSNKKQIFAMPIVQMYFRFCLELFTWLDKRGYPAVKIKELELPALQEFLDDLITLKTKPATIAAEVEHQLWDEETFHQKIVKAQKAALANIERRQQSLLKKKTACAPQLLPPPGTKE